MSEKTAQNGLRTHRPDLDNYVFCNPVVESTMTNWLTSMAEGTATRNLLFTGPPGTGKTSLGLALAAKLGVSSSGFKEINCGSTGTLESARELIEYLNFMPISGNYKVLLLDEVHKMGSRAQEAFLTPLEDLPSFAVIIACTSKPELLDKAFRSRFFQVGVTKYTEEQLAKILNGLPTKITPEVLNLAIRNSDGIPRDAIDIVERLGQSSSEEVKQLVDTKQIVDSLPERLMEALCSAQPNYAVGFLLAGYIEEENKTVIFNKLIKHMENIALGKLGQLPIMSRAENEIYQKCIPYTLVNYWYPHFFKMLTDHPKALRALLAQFTQI